MSTLVTFYRCKHFFRIFPRCNFRNSRRRASNTNLVHQQTQDLEMQPSIHLFSKWSRVCVASIEITSCDYKSDGLFGLLSSSVYPCQYYYSIYSRDTVDFTATLFVLVTWLLLLRWVWATTLRWFLDMWEEIQFTRLNAISTHSRLHTAED